MSAQIISLCQKALLCLMRGQKPEHSTTTTPLLVRMRHPTAANPGLNYFLT